MAAVYVGGRKPGGTPTLVHVYAVVIVGQLESVIALAELGTHDRGVLLHLLGQTRKGHFGIIEKIGIVTRPIRIVLVDDNGLFLRSLRGSNRGATRHRAVGDDRR